MHFVKASKDYECGMLDLKEITHELWQMHSTQPVQPKGTRLSTVCLLCKKPAVTFNTEDDIPYTNYSYCEDCLRKGLKLLKEQNEKLQTQPKTLRRRLLQFCRKEKR